MKNLLLLSFVSLLIFSCETTNKEVDKGPAPGYLLTADGTKIDARDADPANLAIMYSKVFEDSPYFTQ